MTTALPAVNDFSDLEPNLQATLGEVLVCAFVHKHHRALGSVLNLIASPVTLNLLNNWADYSEEASSLYALGSALAAHPSLKKHLALSHGKAARVHFRKEIEKNYLIALLSERLLLPAADPSNWMLQLRLWVLVHALVRARRNVYLDKNLQMLATSMRIACDRDRGWLGFYFRLKPASLSGSFAEINNRIGTSAKRILAFPGLTDTEERTLRAAIALSAFHDKPLPLPADSPLPAFDRPESIKPPSPQLQVDIEDGGGEVLDNPEGTDRVQKKTFPATATPAQRRLSTDTVIMTAREAVMHLPWRWGCPNPYELDRLEKWINDSLVSFPADLAAVLAVAFVWIGYSTGRSAARVLDMEVGNTPSDEWRLDVKHGLLHRIPPMRKPGWLPEDEAAGWVVPSAERIELKLPEPLVFLFRRGCKRSQEAGIVAGLWPASSEKTALQAIDHVLAEVSPRLTGAMLAEALPQRVFKATRDGVLARLIASHPQTALGGAASYAQWTLETVSRLLSGAGPTASSANQIALGSRLAVVDRQLRREILQVISRVRSCRAGDPIRFHNAYTAYVILALSAATGARPISSPFESAEQFDFEEGFVYIDDKHSDAHRRGGRPVPLPKGLLSFLQKRYLLHLEALAALLSRQHPALASEIAAMARGSPSGRMPFFFFLTEGGDAWHEATPTSITQALGLDWPLPDNLFRHRLSNRLRAQDIDSEIIDGILGHCEWGEGPWTDTSFRCWRDDAIACLPALESIFHGLKFRPLRGLRVAERLTDDGKAMAILGHEKFGHRARAEQRLKRIKAAIRHAEIVIQETCGTQSLADLSPDELDALFERLATNGRGLPDTMGGIRVAHLIRQIERIDAKSGKLLLPKRHRRVIHETPGLFSSSVPGALRRWRELRSFLASFRPENPRQRLLAAAVALAVECRISDPRVLGDVAGNRFFRLVSLESRLHLEYGDFSESFEAPCRRFPIFGKAARWIAGLPPDKAWQPGDSVPGWLGPFLDNLGIRSSEPKLQDLFRELARLADQVNALTLPGVLCGVLSGRLVTRSLGWRDWVRLKTGRRIDLGEQTNVSPESDATLEIDNQLVLVRDVKPAAVEVARKAAQVFFENVRAFVRNCEDNATKRKNPRRHLVMQLRAEIKEASRNNVPTSATLLGAWIHDLAEPVGRRVRKTSSLMRYLTALSGRFEIEFADVDLLTADDDDLTEAYSRLLTSKDKLAGPYEVRVLAMFHRWLRRYYGVEDPDWEELPVATSFDVIDPGFVTPDDYLETFKRLGQHNQLTVEDRLAAQMVLCLAYRFGLRRREALGLARIDWDDSADKIVLTVAPNAWRGLKTASSRRQVPQLFPFDTGEEAAIKNMLVRYTAQHGDQHGELLLPCSSWTKVTSVVIETLKLVTGNPGITLHHARHSAANLAAMHALGVMPEPWDGLNSGSQDIAPCLTGFNGISRRHAWAVSRYLGHAGPPTTFRSYLHFLLDWAGMLICSGKDLSVEHTKRIHVLDDLPTLLELQDVAESTEARAIRFSDLLQAFRLHVRGFDAADIQDTLKIPDALLEDIRLALGTKENETRLGNLVAGIQESAWARLIAWAGENNFDAKSSSKPAGIPVAELQKMVGATSQLLAWNKAHFDLLRWALRQFKIDESQYDAYASAGIHQGTMNMVRAVGFKLAPRPRWAARKETQRESLLQIDAADDGPYNEPVQSRIAILLKENATNDIRNRNQLAVLMAAAVLTINHR